MSLLLSEGLNLSCKFSGPKPSGLPVRVMASGAHGTRHSILNTGVGGALWSKRGGG